ncbi:MAG: hypothetical protein V1494_06695, partial [Candidatus Diapherotrites archaeon]
MAAYNPFKPAGGLTQNRTSGSSGGSSGGSNSSQQQIVGYSGQNASYTADSPEGQRLAAQGLATPIYAPPAGSGTGGVVRTPSGYVSIEQFYASGGISGGNRSGEPSSPAPAPQAPAPTPSRTSAGQKAGQTIVQQENLLNRLGAQYSQRVKDYSSSFNEADRARKAIEQAKKDFDTANTITRTTSGGTQTVKKKGGSMVQLEDGQWITLQQAQKLNKLIDEYNKKAGIVEGYESEGKQMSVLGTRQALQPLTGFEDESAKVSRAGSIQLETAKLQSQYNALPALVSDEYAESFNRAVDREFYGVHSINVSRATMPVLGAYNANVSYLGYSYEPPKKDRAFSQLGQTQNLLTGEKQIGYTVYPLQFGAVKTKQVIGDIGGLGAEAIATGAELLGSPTRGLIKGYGYGLSGGEALS